MLKVDKLYFLSRFLWIVVIFVFLYFIIIKSYYKTLRSRYIYEKNVWNKVKKNGYIIKAMENFYSIWMYEIVKKFKIGFLTNFNKINSENKYSKVKTKKRIKRYYSKSNINLVKIVVNSTRIVNAVKDSITFIPKWISDTYNNTVTKGNVFNLLKKQKNTTNSKTENILNSGGELRISEYHHRGIVKGVEVNKDDVNLTYFDPLTSKETHKIDLNISDELQKLLDEKGFKSIIATLNMSKDNKSVNLEENFSFYYKSAITKSVIDTKKIKLDEKNVIKMQKGLGIYLQERTDEFMAVIGWKDYEFLNVSNSIYVVHKDDIYRQGGIILHINMAKAKPITLSDYAKISNKIANNYEVNKFINIDSATKEIFDKNYKILMEKYKD